MALFIFFAACTNSPDGKNLQGFQPFTLTISSKGALHSARALRRATANAFDGFLGLYFSEIEIVAYDYRPGQTVQSEWLGHVPRSDWSFWVVLQNGHEAGRDNFLEVGKKLDIDAYNGDRNFTGLSEDFITKVGQFNVDMFEVNVHSAGALYNGSYYGPTFGNGEVHPLHKYPALSSIPVIQSIVNLNTTPAVSVSNLSIVFVRKDWFPEPVRVELSRDAHGFIPNTVNTPITIESSTRPLSDLQSNLLLNWVSNGTWRRGYSSLILIPFDGPIPIQLSDLIPVAQESFEQSGEPTQGHDGVTGEVRSLPSDASTSTQGGSTGTPYTRFISAKLTVDVNLDLNQVLDPSTNLEASPTPMMVFKTDTNGVPFGLNISFGAR